MAISRELQIGKAGEHLTCCDLILQGYNAFLADAGLPYDVVVEVKGKLKTVQVKSTTKLIDTPKSKRIYRFSMRKGKNNKSRLIKAEVDYIAFVALDIRRVAYFPISAMTARTKNIKSCVEFRSREIAYDDIRVTWNNRKYLQDFSAFPIDRV